MAKRKKAARPKAKTKARVKAKKAKTSRKRPARKAMSEAAMMAQWQEAMTPAAGHARLEPMVGTWRVKTTFKMAHDAPEQVHDGTAVHRLVLGGRFLEQVYSGTAMGMPFEGIGFTGYDNVKKRYVGTWMDTFGTGLMNSVGVGRPTDTKITSLAEAFEPSGKKIVFETTVRISDRDHHSYEMWTKGPNGRKYRVMLGEYERG